MVLTDRAPAVSALTAPYRWDGGSTVRACQQPNWQLNCLCRPGGLALADISDRGLRLRVTDTAAPGSSRTEALLRPDGTGTLHCVDAPAALLVTAAGARLMPTIPGTGDDVALAPGDLLVMCSADALENLSAGIGAVLALSPLRSSRADADGLLEALMHESAQGAALIARYRADEGTYPDDPTSDPHRHEQLEER